MTRTPEEWDERYRNGDLPWDTGRPDGNLVQLVEAGELRPGRVLVVGCGTGTNAVWLAGQGFDVVATDVSPTALEAARERAREAGVEVAFHKGSFPPEGAPFDLAFDRGVFHTLDGPDERAAFAREVARRLGAEGRWLCLAGSTDGPPRDTGPPRRSAAELTTAIEPVMEILRLVATHFDSDREDPPQAWLVLARKRRRWD